MLYDEVKQFVCFETIERQKQQLIDDNDNDILLLIQQN